MLKNKQNNFNDNWKKLNFEKKYCYERKVMKNKFWTFVKVTEKRTKDWIIDIMWFGDSYIENLKKFATK